MFFWKIEDTKKSVNILPRISVLEFFPSKYSKFLIATTMCTATRPQPTQTGPQPTSLSTVYYGCPYGRCARGRLDLE